jgi:hypothetical protein
VDRYLSLEVATVSCGSPIHVLLRRYASFFYALAVTHHLRTHFIDIVPEFNIYCSSWALLTNVLPHYPLLHGVLACGKTTFSLRKESFLLVFLHFPKAWIRNVTKFMRSWFIPSLCGQRLIVVPPGPASHVLYRNTTLWASHECSTYTELLFPA